MRWKGGDTNTDTEIGDHVTPTEAAGDTSGGAESVCTKPTNTGECKTPDGPQSSASTGTCPTLHVLDLITRAASSTYQQTLRMLSNGFISHAETVKHNLYLTH